MSVSTRAAFAAGQYSSATTGNAANTYSSFTLDTSSEASEVLFTISFGFPTSLSASAYAWFEVVENSETPFTSGTPVAIDYSSGRITLPTGYTRHASAGSTEIFRATSGITVLNQAYTFRVALTGGQRYLGVRFYRPAGAGITVPLAGTWTIGLPSLEAETVAFTYDPSTDRGKVRMLITDRNEAKAIFTDAEIDAFLELEDQGVRRAAAAALETIATDQALVLKVITTLDLQTDGAKLSDSLLKRARALRDTDDELGGFDYAEMPESIFSQRERLDKQALRGAL
jgi:hypothetical protein